MKREIFGEPLLDAVTNGVCARGRAFEQSGSAGDLDEVESVNDADTTAGAAAVNGLGIFQVRIHARGFVEKPGLEMLRGEGGVGLLLCEEPRGGKRGHLHAEADERKAVVVEIIGIRMAVALNVRAAGVCRVRPPVVAF